MEKTLKKCQFWSDFKKDYIFEMRIKTGLNGQNKCPKFEKKSNGNVLQSFAFALRM